MIEIFPDPSDSSSPYLRVLNLASEDFANLVALSHLYDYNYNDFLPRYNDINLLNRYKSVWLSGDMKFFEDNKEWIEKIKSEYYGRLFNSELDHTTINNIQYEDDFRVGIVCGETVALSEVSIENEELARNFATDIDLEIGVIISRGGQLYSQTVWDINLNRTDYEAEQSALFIQKISDVLGAPSYWNSVKANHVKRAYNHKIGLFEIDLDYEDIATNKTLFISDRCNMFGTQLEVLIRYKGLDSVEIYNGQNPDSINLNSYDTIVFITGENYADNHPIFIQKVGRTFKGRLINYDCQGFFYRDTVLSQWKGIGPDFVNAFGHNIPSEDEIPFGPPYIMRATKGHAGLSNMTLFYQHEDLKSWPWWIWGLDFADHIIQEYIDVGIHGTFDVGRIMWVGDMLIPMYALETRSWQGRPDRDVCLRRAVGQNCFSELIRGFDQIKDFESQMKHIISLTNIEIGALDFGVKGGRVIPWDVTAKWGHGFLAHQPEASSENFTLLINSLFDMIDNPLRITLDEALMILEEAEIEAKPWKLVRVIA